MKEQPRFIKEFSKQESSEERSQLAHEIWQKRAGNIEQKNKISEREKELQEELDAINQLEKTVFDISENGISRLMNYFKLKNLRSGLVEKKANFDEKQKEEILPPDMTETKRMLENFYEAEKKKWERSPYSKEDVQKYFSEEYLSSLSMSEYILLLRRFPSEMVTHVTRQGVRDHADSMFHQGGLDKYSDGFMKIIKDGRLRSPLGIYITEGMKESAIAKFLEYRGILDPKGTKKEALNRFAERLGQYGDSGSYSDKAAIHFAAEEVADSNYGSEKGNEIFFTFPSAQIASQYYYKGGLFEADSSPSWNDKWVWTEENKGIDINSGLVFIPEDAEVDEKTGSKYKVDKNDQPDINQKEVDSLKKFINSDDLKWYIDKFAESPEKFISKESKENLRSLMSLAENKFGISDEVSKEIFSDIFLLRDFRSRITEDDFIADALRKHDLYFEKPEHTISSKQFWENYFTEHPEQKPSKIVYYKGGDPTKALFAWREEKRLHTIYNYIEREKVEKIIGRKDQDAELRESYGRFKAIAEKVIEDYYGPDTNIDSKEIDEI